MITLDFSAVRNKPVKPLPFQIELAGRQFLYSETFDFGPILGGAAVKALGGEAERLARLTEATCTAQLAALVFEVTGRARALDWYFPITNALGPSELAAFDRLRESIAGRPEFDLRLIGESRTDLTALMPETVRQVASGQLAEVFFYRQPLLERFLSRPRHFLLYATPHAFQDDGGQAGGQFHAERESLQLVLARLFEGFGGETPGVCPFLHEFGHMLDFFDAGAGRMDPASSSFLPGLRPSDGPFYSAEARRLFLQGKRLERERYLGRYLGHAAPTDPLPIGHPYVFQSDAEFIAGYFEMFFRNPHYFAAQNPDLFGAFSEVFGWDPRRAWKADFPFYVESNRRFYRGSERPGPPGLTVPED